MAKISAGKSQLGHSPFGKEKLEGPKVHHDDHGTTASVPGKTRLSEQHWEYKYSMSEKPSDLPSDAFLPKPGKDRPTPHKKVNECDH